MPQKPLRVSKTIKKAPAANRHGKVPKMKKGAFDIKPKKAKLVQKYNDEKDLTTMINAKNESNAAGKAQQNGGQLAVVKAPVLQPADQKQKAKQAKAAAPS
ncbi:hypothetical protein OEZ85_007817 [Tetradesmus obliquus]|uniref:Uncharacterized protein n=1 Tax=Tetradesmus obliquus TaxID=3088 RepID=A0ABY8TJ10_TETOB|nr:hypothetical protein OEZ85_007817 [Tetradesmus obliquus]